MRMFLAFRHRHRQGVDPHSMRQRIIFTLVRESTFVTTSGTRDQPGARCGQLQLTRSWECLEKVTTVRTFKASSNIRVVRCAGRVGLWFPVSPAAAWTIVDLGRSDELRGLRRFGRPQRHRAGGWMRTAPDGGVGALIWSPGAGAQVLGHFFDFGFSVGAGIKQQWAGGGDQLVRAVPLVRSDDDQSVQHGRLCEWYRSGHQQQRNRLPARTSI
mgnify:CR=1 FL=1